jgi:hypothetical protein
VTKLLQCENDRDAVVRAIAASWDGLALEEALTEVQLCAGLVRNHDVWLAHPHAQAVATLPPFDVNIIPKVA